MKGGLFSILTILFIIESAFFCEAKEVTVNDESLVIVAFGDSLSAGYGVAEDESYPALLQKKLDADGYDVRVINAGVSGETSSGALARLDWVLSVDPDIMIVETGANDGLRGIDPEVAKRNIVSILEKLKERNITTLFVGMKMVWNLGPQYVAQFNSIYPELAAEYKPVFMPFFLEGVAIEPALNQDDVLHPNAEGYKVIAENIYPYVQKAIEQQKSK